MNCKKCYYCIQVAKFHNEVRCDHKKIPYVSWFQEPGYCKYYLNKKYTIIKQKEAK